MQLWAGYAYIGEMGLLLTRGGSIEISSIM